MKNKIQTEHRILAPSITRRHFGACLALGLAGASLPTSLASLALGLALSIEAVAQEVIVTEEAGVRTVMTTFEGGGHQQPIAPDTDYWIPGAGMRFQGDIWHPFSPSGWLTFTRPPGNFVNNPSGSTIAKWLNTQNSQLIELADPVFEVFLHYSALGTVRLEALDTAGTVVATTQGLGTGGFDVWRSLSVSVSNNSIVAVRVWGPSSGRTAVDDVGYRRYLPIEVPIDVKPGNGNEIDPINLKAKGSLPLAVFSTADFDATTLDLSTLRLGDPNLVQIAGVISGSAQDLNGDGLLDLILRFGASQLILINGGAINASTTELLLTGCTTAGQSIFGKDQVRIVGGGN